MTTMRVLHLFSNWRWTGPAEPAVNMAVALSRAGWDVTFAAGRPRGYGGTLVVEKARERGLEVHSGLTLNKHINPFYNYPDGRRLREWLRDQRFEVMHCHMRNAHIVAALAARPLPDRPLVIRSAYAGEGPRGYWERRLLTEFTDGLLVVSERARRHVVEAFGFPEERVAVAHTAVDLERFDPERGLGDRRADFGLGPDDFVLGIVARVQWRRRFDVLLQAVAKAREALPNLKLLIVGRGTHIETIAVKPARKMGLADAVLFPGYQRGDDYVRTLATFDAKVFLVPGTDGSCRAVREAMAMGRPVIASRRGMLPELVAHGERGLVVNDTPDELAEAFVAMARDPERRRAMGAAARQFALENFSLERQAEIVGRFYHHIAALGKR